MPRHSDQLSGAADYLKASYIKRWAIVQTADVQSIGLHMYRVWTLVRHWGRALELPPDSQRAAEEWALTHDLAEIRTGDMPTPHKTAEVKAWLRNVEEMVCPEAVRAEAILEDTSVADFCKFCDTAEAILYLSVSGLGRHAKDVCNLLEVQMLDRLNGSRLIYDQQQMLIDLYRSTLSEVA